MTSAATTDSRQRLWMSTTMARWTCLSPTIHLPTISISTRATELFEDASFYSGFALNQDARETASMGLAVGDYANNGRLDLYTTTFSDDYKTLYRNDGDGELCRYHAGDGDCRAHLSVSELGNRSFSITTTMDGRT